MLFLPALYLVLGRQGDAAPRWQPSYSRIFQQTTGNNGYEEFVRAADLLANPVNSVFQSYEYFMVKTPEERAKTPADEKPPTPPGVNPSMTLLDVQREHVRHCAQALELVAKGNEKPVYDPRSRLNAQTVFPELAGFKNLARFAVIEMHVDFADGQPNRATDAAITILQMRSHLPSNTLITELVGVAMDGIILAGINENVEHFSERDWAKLEAVAGERLKSSSFADSMRAEMQFELSNIPIALKGNPDDSGFFGSDDDSGKALSTAVAALSPAQRQSMTILLTERVKEHFAHFLDQLKGPEAHWADTEEPPPVTLTKDPSSVVDALTDLLSPVFAQATAAAVRLRTQMRLLQLHAKIQRYRWHNGHLPAKLEEAAPQDAIDPLTNEPYIYQGTATGYRLASKGIPQTGEIEMRYKRAAGTTGSGQPEPPKSSSPTF